MIPRWTWNRVKWVREKNRVRIYLNDAVEPEIDLQLKAPGSVIASCFVGGRSDNDSNWEGRIDEVVVHNGTTD